MNARISSAEVMMTAMRLSEGFHLGFGVLQDLPRVYLILTIESDTGSFISCGEAAIDFPFSPYDAWDIYEALSKLPLVGKSVHDREDILDRAWEQRLVDGCFAAQTALNMALDDAYARIVGTSVARLYGITRTTGPMLVSVGITANTDLLWSRVEHIFHQGHVPKLKCDANLAYAVTAITVASTLSQKYNSTFVTDFNATLLAHQWEHLLVLLQDVSLSNWLFAEQPLAPLNDAHASLIEAQRFSKLCNGPHLVADESFVTVEDAKTLAKAGVWLNMKIQKIGGIRQAFALERLALRSDHSTRSLVGGTFPTAIGRVYDQCAAAVLSTATLPSDGWQPSTAFLTGPQHMIVEDFPTTKEGLPTIFDTLGLGGTVNWTNLRRARVDTPQKEYHLIRTRGSGEHIRIQLTGDETYADAYQRISGRHPLWNLSA
jgi:L-alanine-DL-glutamate epimerase-like enolase superfamily enzyme